MPNRTLPMQQASAPLHTSPPTSVHAQLENTIELLHLWQNEAHTYRLLAEAVATGRYSHERAKQALAKGTFGPEELRLAFLPLTEAEHRAFSGIAAFARLSPEEFLWACLDTVMGNSEDEDLLAGCREAARRRFQEGTMPKWSE